MSATISPCGQYRYTLHRSIQRFGFRACMIMVNPSTADATENDATIRKVIGFGKRLQWQDVMVVNLFAYRATDVKALASAADPVGPHNDGYIFGAMLDADIIVVAWGASGKLPPMLQHRYKQIVQWADRLGKVLYCFGTCADGHPRHPVMLPYGNLYRWEPPL